MVPAEVLKYTISNFITEIITEHTSVCRRTYRDVNTETLRIQSIFRQAYSNSIIEINNLEDPYIEIDLDDNLPIIFVYNNHNGDEQIYQTFDVVEATTNIYTDRNSFWYSLGRIAAYLHSFCSGYVSFPSDILLYTTHTKFKSVPNRCINIKGVAKQTRL
jgi:hypothetical protein